MKLMVASRDLIPDFLVRDLFLFATSSDTHQFLLATNVDQGSPNSLHGRWEETRVEVQNFLPMYKILGTQVSLTKVRWIIFTWKLEVHCFKLSNKDPFQLIPLIFFFCINFLSSELAFFLLN